jgi:hypothetical protein
MRRRIAFSETGTSAFYAGCGFFHSFCFRRKLFADSVTHAAPCSWENVLSARTQPSQLYTYVHTGILALTQCSSLPGSPSRESLCLCQSADLLSPSLLCSQWFLTREDGPEVA